MNNFNYFFSLLLLSVISFCSVPLGAENICAQNALVEARNDCAQVPVRIEYQDDKGNAVSREITYNPFNTPAFPAYKTLRKLCLSPIVTVSENFRVIVNGTHMVTVAIALHSDGAIVARITSPDGAILANSERDGWNIAGGIGRGILSNLDIKSPEKRILVEVLKEWGQTKAKIYLQ